MLSLYLICNLFGFVLCLYWICALLYRVCALFVLDLCSVVSGLCSVCIGFVLCSRVVDWWPSRFSSHLTFHLIQARITLSSKSMSVPTSKSTSTLTLAKRKTLVCAKKWSNNPFILSCYKMLRCRAPYIRFLFPQKDQNGVDVKNSYSTRFHRGCTHYVLYLLHPAADSSNLV